MAEYIILITISLLTGMIFIILGICQCRSRSPVSLNTGEKPPKPEQLSDVKAWNAGHGTALIMFGIAIAFTCSIFPVILKHADTVITTVAFIAAIVAEIAALEVNHGRLKRKFKIK